MNRLLERLEFAFLLVDALMRILAHGPLADPTERFASTLKEVRYDLR